MSVSSKASEFPDEIWLHIFRDIGTYKGLKRASRINRHFRDLIKDPILDKYLFRAPISKNKAVLDQVVELHPIFYVTNEISEGYHHSLVPFIHGAGNHWVDDGEVTQEQIDSILTYDVFKEFATYPAVTSIKFKFAGGGVLKNTKGIKVKEVMDFVHDMWNTPPSLEDREYLVEVGCSDIVEHAEWLDTLYGRDHFEGFWIEKKAPSVDFILDNCS